MKTPKNTLTIITIIIFSIFAIASVEEQSEITAAIADKRPELTVTATALCQAYQENEIRASVEYGGKVILVTGIIDGIDRDILDEIYVSLDGGSSYSFEDLLEISYVQCYFAESQKNEIANLNIGDRVSIKGKCDDTNYLGGILLNGCTIE